MYRYSEDFRLAVIQDFLSGESYYEAVAKRHGIDRGTVRRWVAANRLHGEVSIKSKYSQYSGAIRQVGDLVPEDLNTARVRTGLQIISIWFRQLRLQHHPIHRLYGEWHVEAHFYEFFVSIDRSRARHQSIDLCAALMPSSKSAAQEADAAAGSIDASAGTALSH